VDSDAFLAAVRTRRVGALAARPVTLLPLLDQFAAARTLPDRLDELFGHAASRLCTTPPGRDSHHSPAERVALAARLAAALTLGARQAVATAAQAPELGADMPLGELGGGGEPTGMGEVLVSFPGLQEALDTGLFVGLAAQPQQQDLGVAPPGAEVVVDRAGPQLRTTMANTVKPE
jgi:hypothetical protein